MFTEATYFLCGFADIYNMNVLLLAIYLNGKSQLYSYVFLVWFGYLWGIYTITYWYLVMVTVAS